MKYEALKDEAMKLEPESRASLARDLLESLDALPEAEIERLWIEEAIRRDDEIDRGVARTIPLDEVMALARSGLR